MLQLQYLNTKLNSKHINKILDNYKIKYQGIKIEIESKINDMIKLFLKDILGFLENIEVTANRKKKLNNYEKMKNELDSIRNELKMKTYNENKTKNELDLLSQENALLKVKIKSLNQKILNLNNNISNNIKTNNTYCKSPLIRKSVKQRTLMTPKLNIRSLHHSTKLVTNFSKKCSNSVNDKIIIEKEIDENNIDISNGIKVNSSSCVLPKKEKANLKNERNKTERNNIDKEQVKSYLKKTDEKIIINNRKVKKINYNKFVNNKKKNIVNKINISTFNNSINNSKKNIAKLSLNKKGSKTCSPGPILSVMNNIILKQKNGNSSSKSNKSNPKKGDTHNYSPDNSFDLLPELSQDYKEIENKVNSAFDEELKQLELDEENIKRLIEQLNNGFPNDLILTKFSGDSKFSISD